MQKLIVCDYAMLLIEIDQQKNINIKLPIMTYKKYNNLSFIIGFPKFYKFYL